MDATDPTQLFLGGPTRPANSDGGEGEPTSPDTPTAPKPVEYVDLFSHADTHRPR